MLGYVGSHRVGKTTLAQAYAEETESTLVRVNVSEIVSEIGYEPSLTGGYDFATRMEIQEHILEQMGRIFSANSGGAAVTDRTPLDALIYTMSNVGPYTCNVQQSKWLKDYADRCFDMANRHFSVMLCIQPGIPLVDCETSAPANPAYIEHLNTLALGLISDERLTVPHYYVPRRILSIDSRVQVARRAVQRAMLKADMERSESGLALH